MILCLIYIIEMQNKNGCNLKDMQTSKNHPKTNPKNPHELMALHNLCILSFILSPSRK